MEVIAFAIGLDPLLSRGLQLVDQYTTWKGNKAQAPQLRDEFMKFEMDLDTSITDLREKTTNLSQESRAVIDDDIAALTGHLTSARVALQNVNQRINRSPVLQFFRAKAVAKDCDTLVVKLEDTRKRLGDLAKYVNVLREVQKVETGQREIVDSLQKYLPASSSSGSEEFHAYYDVPYNTSKLFFSFDAKDEHGNVATQEGRLLQLLLDDSPDMNREIGVRGIGGVGKTSFLRMIRSLTTIKERFTDGVYYIAVGMDATHGELIESLSNIVESSGGAKKAEQMRGETNMKKVMNTFRSWFANKRCLFLVDDVWETEEIPLNAIHELTKLYISGRDSKTMLTTRSTAIASETDTYFELEPRSSLGYESREILSRYSGIENEGDESDIKVVNKILELCGGLPLFLALAGKAVRTLSFRHGHVGCMAYHVYAQSLESRMESLLTTRTGDYRPLSAQLKISIELLEERKEDLGFPVEPTVAELHRRLSVIPKQGQVPMSMLSRLWGLHDNSHAASIAREFEQVGLADVDFQRRGSGVVELLRIHDSVYAFAVNETREHGEERLGHETLVRGYGRRLTTEGKSSEWWHTCLEPDGYLHENICRHLLGAGRASELVDLLLKPQWAERQLKVSGIALLKNDFSIGIKVVQEGTMSHTEEEYSEMERALQLISDAVTLSSPFVSKNHRELCFQMHGRLKRYRDRLDAIQEYVGLMEMEAARPIALCLNDFLEGPDGPNTKITAVGVKVWCMVMLGDGERVACGCENGFIVLVNVHEGEVEKRWKAHSNIVWAIAVARNGTLLISGSSDGTAKVWDVATHCCLVTFGGHTGVVKCVEVMNDGNRVVSASSDGGSQIWEIDTGRTMSPRFKGHEGSIECLALLRDREKFITGGKDKKLQLWNATTGNQIGDPFEGHENAINCLALTPDEGGIVSGSDDGTVRIWDVESHREIAHLFKEDGCSVMSVDVSKDGSRIAFGLYYEHMIRVWDSESGTQVCDPLEEHGQAVTGVSFLANANSIVSCSFDGTVRVWDTQRKRTDDVVDRHRFAVWGVSFTPNGKFVVSASWDTTLRIWDPTSGQRVGDPLKGHSHFVTDVVVTPNGRYVVSVSKDKTVGVWDFESHKQLHTLTGHTDEIRCVAVTPNGNHAMTGSDDESVRIWDLSAMDSSRVVLEGHRAGVERVCVADDGLRVVLTH